MFQFRELQINFTDFRTLNQSPSAAGWPWPVDWPLGSEHSGLCAASVNHPFRLADIKMARLLTHSVPGLFRGHNLNYRKSFTQKHVTIPHHL